MLYRDRLPWWLTSHNVIAAAKNEQDQRYVADPWDDPIGKYLERRTDTSIAEILSEVLHLELSKRNQPEQNRVAKSLRALGWIKYQHRSGDRRTYRYRPQG